MPIIQVSSRQVYDVTEETVFLLQVAAASGPSQTIQTESLTISGATDSSALESFEFGCEQNRSHRFVCPAGQVTIEYAATVETELAIVSDPQPSPSMASLPPETLRYTVPSRYCESDKLADWAAQTFGNLHPDDSRVMAIANWIYEQFSYTPGATGAWTSAADIVETHQGVCRDYAHLMIAACRALEIPARYVSGYVADLQPPDFHALVEAYVGDGWYLFDPTRLAPRTGLVRIARGLDAAETAFCTIIGAASLVDQEVMATRQDEPAQDEPVRIRVG